MFGWNYTILIVTTALIMNGRQVKACSVKACRDSILYSVFGTFLVYSIVVMALFFFYSFKKKRRKKNEASSKCSNRDVDGELNHVYDEDNDDLRSERKRQDSGFIASSNESIVPFPDMDNETPKRSPSMPNLPIRSTTETGHPNNEDVFDSSPQLLHIYAKKITDSTKHNQLNTMSVATTTDNFIVNNDAINFVESTERLLKQSEVVVIEKKTANCTGLDFGIGGIFIKDFDANEIVVKRGSLSPGDEVLSINDYPLNGLSDMEAFSFFAKSGSDVTLEIVKGGFLSKVENASIKSDESSLSSDEEDVKYPVIEGIGITSEQLPRVIADANNLSLDYTNVDTSNKIALCNCIDNKPVNGILPYASNTTIIDSYGLNNGVLSMEHLRNSSTDENCNKRFSHQHQRNSRSSCENQQHSWSSSYEQGRVSSASSTENIRHSKNMSIENNKHSRHSSDDDRNLYISRTHSDDVSILHSGALYQRSSSNDGSSVPMFTVESFARKCDGHSSDRDAQLYFQERLLRHQSLSIDQSNYEKNAQSISSDQYPQVTQALLADNVVVKRGYNSDYIVPVNYGVMPPSKGLYPSRTRDPSPSRRTPPQVTSQINYHMTSNNISPLAVTAANNNRSVSSASNISSGSPVSPLLVSPLINAPIGARYNTQDSHRKSPSESNNMQLRMNDFENLSSPYSEIDADVMRYMTKKYSEPRFVNGHRKDPPPYLGTHTTLSASSSAGGDPNDRQASSKDVILRRSATSVSSAIRSRPHSLIENGIANTYDLTDRHSNVYIEEKRKHPQRTHSLPAVKHLEMRPRAAQSFLNEQATVTKKKTPKKLRHSQKQDSLNRRKSIDSGTLRKLAEEIQVNPALGGEYPIIAQLLGESQYSAIERRAQGLYRHKSTEALSSQF